MAAHTIPSPVWQDDPSFETVDYYDDGEDVSDDDYFDHQPSGEAVSTQDSQNVESVSKDDGGSKRRAPRTSPIEIVLARNPNQPGHGRWIRGTVWKRSQGPRENEHVPGQDQRIALLRNWREVFRHSQPESDRLREERHSKRRREDSGNLERRGHLSCEGGTNRKSNAEESNDQAPLTRKKRKAMEEPVHAASREKRIATKDEVSPRPKRSLRPRKRGS